MERIVDAAIKRVSVYPGSARVTAAGRTEISQGTQRLLVRELPMDLVTESFRASGRGTSAVQIISVDVRRTFFERPPVEQITDLENEIENLTLEVQSLEDESSALAAQLAYVDGLRKAAEQFARGLSRGQTTVADLADSANYMLEEDRRLRRLERENSSSKKDLNRKLGKLKRELAQLSPGSRPQRYEAAIEIDAQDEGQFELEVSYVVNKANWRPLYDLRVSGDGNDRQVILTTLAEVSQSTGQDWLDVQLNLSTARPALNQRMPELRPWYLDVWAPPVMPAPARSVAPQPKHGPMAARMESELDVAFAAASSAAEQATAQVHSEGLAVSYDVAGTNHVYGDGTPRKVTIGKSAYPPELDYLTVPKHTDAVFRRIKLVNKGTGPLLAGAVNLFVGDEFIGTSAIEFTSQGEEVELLLGAEDRIRVERELIIREVDKTLIRDRRQLKYGYRIKLQNYLAEEVSIEVKDQYPVARHEEIKVRLSQADPQPTDLEELHILAWKLRLAPESKQEITFEFQVEHPRTISITGLID